MQRVAAIGLDAAEWTFIERMMADGELPALAQLHAGSAKCLLTTHLANTGLVWEGFSAGRDPGRDVISFDPSTYDTKMPVGVRLQPFFHDAGVPVVAFDVPGLSPAFDTLGANVSAWGAHSPLQPRTSRPKGLIEEIDARFGKSPTHPKYACDWQFAHEYQSFGNSLSEATKRRAEISCWLMEKFPDWQLFMTVLAETHDAGELLWHGEDTNHPLNALPQAELALPRLKSVYRAADEAISKILAQLPEDAIVIVFSVHGMRDNTGDIPSMVLLPELLHRLHFGTPFLKNPFDGWKERGCPLVIPNDPWESYMRHRAGRTVTERTRNAIARNVPLPLMKAKRSLGSWLRQRAGGSLEPGVDPDSIEEVAEDTPYLVPTWYRDRWPQMRFFALPSFGEGKIRLNLQGREAQGTVSPEDRDSVCKEIEEVLRSCVDPRTRNSVVEEIHRSRDTWTDHRPSTGADLDILWSPGVDAFQHPELGIIGPFPFRRTGGHTPRGFAFIRGPGIDRTDLGERPAADLPPTILELLGATPGPEIEGSPLPVHQTDGAASPEVSV